MEQFVLCRFKINLIDCLLDNCNQNCSSYKIIKHKFEQIKIMLSRNAYFKHFLDNK